jgi:peptidoglycan/xylan/chitin deacetylase (PgdA/CDA1 family)
VSDLRVALTFDAEHGSRSGADPSSPSRILDALDAAGVRATFFVQGRWATAFPSLARRIADDGHLVGNHSNYHAPMTLLSPAGVVRDVQEAEHRIADVTGVDPRPWFRCPFGDGEDDAAVRDTLTELGYRIVPWNLDSGDWRDEATRGAVEAEIANGLTSRDNGDPAWLVLFHSWPRSTAEALPGVLARLAQRGAEFVTVEEANGGA